MNIEQLRQAINSSHSATMTIRFIKADGTERIMLAKTNVKRFLSRKPNKRKVVRNNPNLACVFDMQSKSYKSFKLDSVIEYKCKRIILK